jgi:hypothetical protein
MLPCSSMTQVTLNKAFTYSLRSCGNCGWSKRKSIERWRTRKREWMWFARRAVPVDEWDILSVHLFKERSLVSAQVNSAQMNRRCFICSTHVFAVRRTCGLVVDERRPLLVEAPRAKYVHCLVWIVYKIFELWNKKKLPSSPGVLLCMYARNRWCTPLWCGFFLSINALTKYDAL